MQEELFEKDCLSAVLTQTAQMNKRRGYTCRIRGVARSLKIPGAPHVIPGAPIANPGAPIADPQGSELDESYGHDLENDASKLCGSVEESRDEFQNSHFAQVGNPTGNESVSIRGAADCGRTSKIECAC